ncbi:17beta-estradiol 17-dehydrogenase / very-long-chain 3-oxoacyl-CoA reductase [Marchantia polymorpha subsp. ruderalis]|uniref:Uncharacterized protein n=2 Tax=Marchantia polymorpha TaxID=3197 RepID=A0A176VC39_MARPO|nr:hypothetical protein AXG93_3426s1170 [Marchantia polymorpha subsp. ruderalis]PTQ45585.1 hypothetical protein MARPO_0014s0112 [Marchantia polymorpha]BBM98140.1 hypothetical protein Mp_1g11150 [Marchantia polymorpha subsp. ruderalis]|eukprot:PTQ45585.1 hypothetical protein MARPO_0014s0112 [Marchantia polymorpha]
MMEGASAEYVVLLALAALGFVYVLRQVFMFVKWTWQTLLRPGKKLSKYGSWALVTGATDGIGRACCMRLAQEKINVIVVGRSPSKVQEVVKELESKNVQVRSAVVDFTEEDLNAGLARIESAIAGLDVGILVNSVGLSYPYAKFFHEVDAQLTRNLIRVNVEVTTRMVQMVLPDMLKRRKGAIINVGSGAASILPSDPLYALYAASKAFVDQLSRSLYVEYKHSGIDVQCQVPLYVATKMSKIRRASLAVPSADTYAKCSLKWIGFEPRCTPYWVHSIMWWIIWVLPESIIDTIRLRSSLDVRRRGQSKDSRGKKE